MENKAALVLVLDPDIRRAIAEALEAHGITALCCDTIGCCRSRLLNGIIDMCLLSQRLADGDALDLVRELRATEAAIGLIVLGEGHDELDAVLALEMGADDYLGGPPRMRELVARVTAVLRRLSALPPPHANGNGALQDVGGIVIDGAARRVTLACGAEADLTALEFDVLMVLAANTDAVLSRARILQAVHGRDWSVNDRAIDGIVSRLRRKLFAGEKGAKRIRTVHGRGYMMLSGE